ncbi:MAG: DUF3291 domain-containing protein [Pseudomonadota bacterium]
MHAEALKRGREWFQRPNWPPLVLWWHEQCGNPTWSDGVARIEYLQDHGPSPCAFTFKEPFDEAGSAMKIDRFRVRKLKMRNQSGDT